MKFVFSYLYNFFIRLKVGDHVLRKVNNVWEHGIVAIQKGEKSVVYLDDNGFCRKTRFVDFEV